jgi:hypothetical protein
MGQQLLKPDIPSNAFSAARIVTKLHSPQCSGSNPSSSCISFNVSGVNVLDFFCHVDWGRADKQTLLQQLTIYWTVIVVLDCHPYIIA